MSDTVESPSRALHRALVELLERDEPCATATITGSSGSIPNGVGAEMLVDAGGTRIAGTVGGGAIEHRCIDECVAAIAAGEHRSFSYHLTDEAAGGIGMMCGGRADIFVRVYRSAPHVVLCGAGHINLELARIVAGLGFAVTVIDDREDWANCDNYPRARVINEDPCRALDAVRLDGQTYVVIGTRERDIEVLAALAGRPVRYVGVVASKRKAINLVRELAERGVDVAEAFGDRLYAPIGLDTGGRTPADIALSIAAELSLLRHGGSPAHMRVAPEEHARLATRRDLKVS